jgi:hypothetical protein
MCLWPIWRDNYNINIPLMWLHSGSQSCPPRCVLTNALEDFLQSTAGQNTAFLHAALADRMLKVLASGSSLRLTMQL